MKTLITIFSMVFSATAMAGIANTKHNLGSNGTGSNNVAETTEICVFCHTPHGADTSAPVPLWNRGLPDGSTYTTYATLGTSTLDGISAQTGSVSLACLSCHDGTQAMDSLINAPGSGDYTDPATSRNWTWTGSNTVNGAVTNLSTDLSNDHPISIEYCGGGHVGGGSSTCVDADFVAPTKHASKNIWWVDTAGGTANRDKTDMILYTRNFTTDHAGNTVTAGDRPMVECASCHDPHVEAKGANEVSFLRVSQADSGLCLACHTK